MHTIENRRVEGRGAGGGEGRMEVAYPLVGVKRHYNGVTTVNYNYVKFKGLVASKTA